MGRLATPALIINLKTYATGHGEAAVKLARQLSDAAADSKVTVALAVSAVDIYRMVSETDLPIFAQHIDNVSEWFQCSMLPLPLGRGNATSSLQWGQPRRRRVCPPFYTKPARY